MPTTVSVKIILNQRVRIRPHSAQLISAAELCCTGRILRGRRTSDRLTWRCGSSRERERAPVPGQDVADAFGWAIQEPASASASQARGHGGQRGWCTYSVRPYQIARTPVRIRRHRNRGPRRGLTTELPLRHLSGSDQSNRQVAPARVRRKKISAGVSGSPQSGATLVEAGAPAIPSKAAKIGGVGQLTSISSAGFRGHAGPGSKDSG